MAKVGYARVSTHEQNLDLQMDALKQAGCIRIFKDKISGSKEHRKELDEALDYVRPGDTLVVWRLDRAGRSLRHLIDLLQLLQEKGVDLITLTGQERIDTTSSTGKLMFHLMAILAEFERDLIRERTKAGLEAARARGRVGGRHITITPKNNKVRMAQQMHTNNTDMPITEMAKTLGISRATFYRYLNVGKE